MNILQSPSAYIIVGSSMLGLPFLYGTLWPLAFVGFVVLLYGVYTSTRLVTVFWCGWFAGTIKAALVLVWFLDTYPLQWVAFEEGVGQWLVVAAYWITVSLSMGFGVAVFAWSVKRYVVEKSRVLILLVPLLWVLTEVLGSIAFATYSWGPGGSPSIEFSFGYLGYVFAHHGVISMFAAVGGVYLLSYVGAVLGTVLYICIRPCYAPKTIVCAGVILGVTIATAQVSVLNTSVSMLNVTVIAVDTTFPANFGSQEEHARIKQRALHEAVETALQADPYAVLLPEDSRFTAGLQFGDGVHAFLKKLEGDTILIDTGRVRDERGKVVLRAHIYDAAKKQIYSADKKYLVPQGEFVPHLIHGLLRAIGKVDLYENIARNQNYVPGVRVDPMPPYIPGVLFCSESVSPLGIVRATRAGDVPFIVHPVSHAWFHDSRILQKQLEDMLSVHARWSGLPIVSAGNMTMGALYMPDGRIVSGETVATGTYWRAVKYSF